MKKLGTAFVLVAVLLALGTCAQAKSVTLVHSFQSGQIDNYKMTMDMRLSIPCMPQFAGKPINMKMTSAFRQKVLGILPDGSARVRVSYSQCKMSCPQFPQMPMKQTSAHSVTVTMAKDGRLLSMDGMNQMTSGIPGMDFSQLANQMGYYGVFPSDPVQVGQSWTKDISLPFNSGTVNLVSTLEGAAVPVGKAVACKIRQNYQAYMNLGALVNAIAASGKVPVGNVKFSGGLQMTGWTVLYFSPDRGKLLKADGKAQAGLTMEMPQALVQQGAPQSMNMDMHLNINITRV